MGEGPLAVEGSSRRCGPAPSHRSAIRSNSAREHVDAAVVAHDEVAGVVEEGRNADGRARRPLSSSWRSWTPTNIAASTAPFSLPSRPAASLGTRDRSPPVPTLPLYPPHCQQQPRNSAAFVLAGRSGRSLTVESNCGQTGGGQVGGERRRGSRRRQVEQSPSDGRLRAAQQRKQLRWRLDGVYRALESRAARVRRWLIPTSLAVEHDLAGPDAGEADQRPSRAERATDGRRRRRSPAHQARRRCARRARSSTPDVVTDAGGAELLGRDDRRRTTRSPRARGARPRRRCGAGRSPRRRRHAALVEHVHRLSRPEHERWRSTSNVQTSGRGSGAAGRGTRSPTPLTDQAERSGRPRRGTASRRRALGDADHDPRRGAGAARSGEPHPGLVGGAVRLARLHGRQDAATFSHTCSPRDRGMTWSIDSALRPQYWQR